MNIQEAIIKAIENLTKFYEDHGDLNGAEYIALLTPLHNALLELSKNKEPKNENTNNN